ncbi:selenoprotein S-like [Oppia nitens]|uniref:selenoprotein S-like n=1 Tax=Oppia nitens TaxID=1686743 RepID=UPI0023DC545E|nr:selenoprotein S-like [Oppia nitens]
MADQLTNSDPKLVKDTISLIGDLLVQYGWYLLLAIISIAVVYNKYLSPLLDRLRHQRANEDTETVANRVQQLEAARRRQQELYDKKAQEFKQKEAEIESKKQEEVKQLLKSVDPNKPDSMVNALRKRQSKPLRDNSYNPLMGSSSGSTFRPSRSCGPSSGG